MPDDKVSTVGMQPAGALLKPSKALATRAAPSVSKRMRRKLDAIELVRERRDNARQEIAYSSRPFILCGIPIHQPKGRDNLLYVRKNGRFSLKRKKFQ